MDMHCTNLILNRDLKRVTTRFRSEFRVETNLDIFEAKRVHLELNSPRQQHYTVAVCPLSFAMSVPVFATQILRYSSFLLPPPVAIMVVSGE
jgi:hypothetical protein